MQLHKIISLSLLLAYTHVNGMEDNLPTLNIEESTENKHLTHTYGKYEKVKQFHAANKTRLHYLDTLRSILQNEKIDLESQFSLLKKVQKDVIETIQKEKDWLQMQQGHAHGKTDESWKKDCVELSLFDINRSAMCRRSLQQFVSYMLFHEIDEKSFNNLFNFLKKESYVLSTYMLGESENIRKKLKDLYGFESTDFFFREEAILFSIAHDFLEDSCHNLKDLEEIQKNAGEGMEGHRKAAALTKKFSFSISIDNETNALSKCTDIIWEYCHDHLGNNYSDGILYKNILPEFVRRLESFVLLQAIPLTNQEAVNQFHETIKNLIVSMNDEERKAREEKKKKEKEESLRKQKENASSFLPDYLKKKEQKKGKKKKARNTRKEQPTAPKKPGKKFEILKENTTPLEDDKGKEKATLPLPKEDLIVEKKEEIILEPMENIVPMGEFFIQPIGYTPTSYEIYLRTGGTNREWKKTLHKEHMQLLKTRIEPTKENTKNDLFNEAEKEILQNIIFAPESVYKQYSWKKIIQLFKKAGWEVDKEGKHLTPRKELHALIGSHTVAIHPPHGDVEGFVLNICIPFLKCAFKNSYGITTLDDFDQE